MIHIPSSMLGMPVVYSEILKAEEVVIIPAGNATRLSLPSQTIVTGYYAFMILVVFPYDPSYACLFKKIGVNNMTVEIAIKSAIHLLNKTIDSNNEST